MAFTSYFYDGSVAETPWSKAALRVGRANYGVLGINDLKVTVAAGDRTVSIGTGECWGKGVYDISDSAVTKSLATVGSGDRYDLIVVHRDWNTNTTTIEVVTGSATRGIPTRDTGYGTEDDQPIALVKVKSGSTTIQEIIDLRCWSGSGGGMVAVDELAMQYLDEVGTTLMIQKALWVYSVTAASAGAWLKDWTTKITPLGVTGWSITGDLTLDTSSGRGHVTGQIVLTRTSATAFALTNPDYTVIGSVIPPSIRSAAAQLRYLVGQISGGGAPYQATINVALSPGSGVISARSQPGISTSVPKNANIFVNIDYYL
ncbi:hypothetical protein [Arthrobacter sp. HY1533]|uniref:hypothetical protein n=1 Tax=Arthrobacter sp. HY1533 TaxID=2970919 RepID=UPI0022B9D729|nr:hypothetical protein [Arthrobacter sp. HY1533]